MSHESKRAGLTDAETKELDGMFSQLFNFGQKTEPEPEPEPTAQSVAASSAEMAEVLQDIAAMAIGVRRTLVEGSMDSDLADSVTAETYLRLVHRVTAVSNG